MNEVVLPLKVIGNLRGDGTFVEDARGTVIAEFADNSDIAHEFCDYINKKEKLNESTISNQ